MVVLLLKSYQQLLNIGNFYRVNSYLYPVPTPHEILKKYWGFDSFRKNQEEIINSLLENQDTLALLPTGGGKSICFQVPGLVREGVCLVISPLIALMQDQVQNLTKKGVKAVALTSGMSFRDIDRELDNCIFGKTKFLYVSPERIKSDIFIARFQQMNVNFIAVDESHCISQWGHDFRPSYLEIHQLRELKPNIPIIAVTATATAKVREEIIKFLHLKNVATFESSFKRDNLSYVNIKTENKPAKLIELCQKIKGSGIVYCNTRSETMNVSNLLKKNEIGSEYYHAGLHPTERIKIQEDWIQNKTKIIVATNAFGMGVDKPNVRFVIHFSIPATPEAYFQEAGRAGRDEKKARAIILFHNKDLKDTQKRVRSKYPEIDTIKRVYKAVCNYFRIAFESGKDTFHPIDLNDFANQYEFNLGEVYHSLKILELNETLSFSEDWSKKTKVRITLENQNLYQFILQNKVFEPLLLLLTRSYPGIFNHSKTINEFEITKHLELSVKEIQHQLSKLSKLEVIELELGTNLPVITFTENRIRDDYFNIKPEVYQQLKVSSEEKLQVMVNYVNSNNCRVNLLLEYFDQEIGKECGKCDYCLNLNNTKIRYSEKSCEILLGLIEKNNPIVIHDLMKLTNPLKTNETIAKLEWLNENGFIWLKDEWVSLK